MTRFERLAVRITRWFSPTLDRLLHSAGGARDALATFYEAADLLDVRREQALAWKRECREAAAMYSGQTVSMTESKETYYESLPVHVKERFWELELALEDRGWQHQLALAQMEFSRYGIQQIMLFSRLYAIKNPLTQRSIKCAANYVFGRGLDISCLDEKADNQLQQFLKDNAKELGHIGLVEKDESLRHDGNLFFCFFVDSSTGDMKVRTIDAVEVQEILTDPEDVSIPNYYLRTWGKMTYDDDGRKRSVPMNAWYPAINFDPPVKPKTMRGFPVMWDTPVFHVKQGHIAKWLFGCPEVYSGIDWARAYKEYLEAWASITQTLRRFAWNVETQGGTQAMANFSRVLSTTLADGGTAIETNPPNVVGSTFVTGPGNKLTPIRTAGTVTNPEEGRRMLLMFCASCGLPETFFGDTSTGSLATAQSLDRPTELMFLQRQELWREILQTICVYALTQQLKRPNGKLREAMVKAGVKPENVIIEGARAKLVQIGSNHVRVFEAPRNVPGKVVLTVKVDFPSVLEHDITQRITAIIEAMGLNGFDVTGIDEKVGVGMLLAELGYEEWPELLEKMYPEGEYDPERKEEPQVDPATLTPNAPPVPGEPLPPQQPSMRKAHVKRANPKESEQFKRALVTLRQVLAKNVTNGHTAAK